MAYNGFIGRVAEVRLTVRAADTLPKRQYERLLEWVNSFNRRGPGNFKCAVSHTVPLVESHLRAQLQRDVKYVFETLSLGNYTEGLLEFRINANAIEESLCWEGFNIQNGNWIQL